MTGDGSGSLQELLGVTAFPIAVPDVRPAGALDVRPVTRTFQPGLECRRGRRIARRDVFTVGAPGDPRPRQPIAGTLALGIRVAEEVVDRHVGALAPGHVSRLRIFPQRRKTDRPAMLVHQPKQLVLDGENPFVRRGEGDGNQRGCAD